jgi:5-amino-6-(5-phospho-D-ribitylamino)uracil phosphatase
VVRFRLVASDLDGTLLDACGQVPARVRAMVERLEIAGVTLALATARRWTGALPVAAALSPREIPLILYDGAQIRWHPSGEILASQTLPAATAQLAAEVFAAHELQPIAQYGGLEGEHLRVADGATHPEWAADYLATAGAQARLVPLSELCVGQPDPLRVVAFAPLAWLRRTAVELARLGCGRQLLLLGSYGMAELTVFAPGVSKGAALVTLAERLGIPLAETMALGDGANDASLLRAAGFSVAMAHAPRRIRALATVVAPAGEDGAAAAVERWVLDHNVW